MDIYLVTDALRARSSQSSIDRSLRSFINDVHAGQQDPIVIQNVLSKLVSPTTKEEAWAEIQGKLAELGITPELSTRDRDYIVSILHKAVDEEDILRHIQPTPATQTDEPVQATTSNDSPNGTQAQSGSTPDYYRDDFGLSDKMPVPRTESRANFRINSLANAQPIPDDENLPIPVEYHREGMGDSDKQVVTTARDDDLPIPVSATFSPVEDADKEVIPFESLSTYTGVESASSHRSADAHSASEGSSSLPSPVLTSPTSRCPSNKSIKSSKRPSIMSRMKFKLSNSKDEFIALIQAGNYASVQAALDKGADADTMNLQGQTALMVSCSFGHESIVQLLLEYGAHVNKMSNKGDTALTVAASRGFEGIVRLLLGRGAGIDGSKNIGKTALSTAAENGHENMVRILFNSGADINALCHTGDTALCQAADNGYQDITRFLLDNGALVDLTAYPRKTPLYKAVYRGHTVIVQLLLERGADPNRADSIRGQSPLMIAALYRRTEIIYLLQQLGHQVPTYDFQPLTHSYDGVIF